eukprot:178458-Prymnesium_polylepis.1
MLQAAPSSRSSADLSSCDSMQMPKGASTPPACQCKMQPKTRHLASQRVKDAPFGGSRDRVTTTSA